jgi:O-antigen biosynthesis protein
MKAKKPSLRDLFAEHSGKVSDKWDIYISEYDRLFQPYRDKPVRLLEIGIQNGGSLEIWSKYFPNAKKIVGCDTEPLCRQLSFDDVEIAVVVADANTDEAQHYILEHSSSFDIMIDDGSHKSSDIIKSFVRYFSYLKDGGLYVAEDLHCSYWLDFEGGLYQPYSSIAFFKKLADTINHEHWGNEQSRTELLRIFTNEFSLPPSEAMLEHIHSIEFINSICVVRKKIPSENKLGKRLIVGKIASVWESAATFNGTNSTPENQHKNKWSIPEATSEEALNLKVKEINELNIQLNGCQNSINLLTTISADQKQVYETQIVQLKEQLTANAFSIVKKEREFAQELTDVRQLHARQVNDQGVIFTNKENVYLSQIEQARRVIETQLQQLAQREQAFSEQLQTLQKTHAESTNEQNRSYSEREQVHLFQLAQGRTVIEAQLQQMAQREQEFSEQLQTLQKTHAQNTNEQNRLHSEREQTHLSQLAQGRTVIETQLQEMTQRERYFSEQLQKIEQCNAKLINDSRSDNLEREKSLNAQISNLNAHLSNQQNQWATIQKEIASQANAFRNKAEAIVSTRFWRWSEPIRRIANIFGHESPASALYGLISEAKTVTFSDYPQNLELKNSVDTTSLSPTLPLNNNYRIVDMSSTNFDIAASSLENLLSHQDEQFVFSAYRTLLGRSPDPDGLGYYLSRLRSGVEKIEIIAQLRLSKEGKSREVKIAGLEVLIRSHLRQKRALWNRVRRIYGSKNYETARSLRAIENRVYLLDEQVKKNVATLNESFRRIENSIQNQERNEIQAHRKSDKTSQILIATNEVETHPFIDKTSAASQIQSDLNLKMAITSGTDKNDADQIRVTVVILTKNPGPIFKEVLIAALNQDTPWHYETLVVDSGSTDGTVGFVRSFTDVRLLEIKSSEFGHGRTRNFAVSMAKGQYVAMLTHDAKPMNQNWLVNLVKPLEGNSTVAGVFGRHKAYSEHTHYIKRDMEMHFNGFLQWPAVMGIEDPERYAREEGYRQVLHFFSDNNACLRKEIWKKIPYPDVNFAEDQLWAKAVIEAGYKRAYADDAVVYHSHDYSIKDTFRRSFDESRALKTLFGYDLCPSARHGVYQMYACAKSDLNFLSESVGIRKALGLALKTPFLHVAKQSGWFIGRYQGKLQTVLFWLFSLDGAKKRQSNMSLLNKIKSIFSTSKELASSNAVNFDQPPIVEAKQQAPGHNKTDVIGFYDFVITKDAGCLPTTSKVFEEKTINWFIPDFGIGSGGHLNIFRFIQMLEKGGYKSTICIVGAHRHESPFQARALISEHFFKLQAEVVFGAENLGSSCYSFATSWITAYALKGFSATAHKLYFVQDFEPAFYSHGSEFDFAEETYKFGFTGVCAGNWLATKLQADYGMRCHTIGFSYDRDLYQQTHRREPHKQRVFCYCRPPTVRRGWESAMLALSLVGQRMPNVEFIFAGWDMGNYHFPYEHLNAGVCKLTELPDLFSQCDAALVFSFTNLSLLPLELMSCGCVVVSNRAPNTEWLLNDANSVLPKSSAPRAIADAIIDVLTDTKKRTDLAARAKKFASSTNWETEGKRLEKVLIGLNQ